jgi:uncharacterized protein (DUF169 family)
MSDWKVIDELFMSALESRKRPVAVSFLDTPPVGIAAFKGVEPAGCSFWRMAAEGKSFYTVPADHYNCPIGSHTHNIPLPAEQADELGATLAMMSDLGYLSMDEVPGIPQLPQTPEAVVYTPLAETPVDPDVVLVVGRPGKIMLLQEAAIAAGYPQPTALLARPTCMALPMSVGGAIVASTACVGNRVYTDLGDDEVYLSIPGRYVPAIAERIPTILAANAALCAHHQQKAKMRAASGE